MVRPQPLRGRRAARDLPVTGTDALYCIGTNGRAFESSGDAPPRTGEGRRRQREPRGPAGEGTPGEPTRGKPTVSRLVRAGPRRVTRPRIFTSCRLPPPPP